jgi:DNA-binding GntR family transcriptional regulator
MTPEKPLRALQRRSLEMRASDELRAAIIAGRYAPGSRLTEVQLSEYLGISRGTVRSALLKLLTEGLVAQRPYAAWEVIGLTPQDAWELFTLRGALEGLAAELVAYAIKKKTLSPEPLQAAFSALVRACEAGDLAGADEADYAFHKQVLASSSHRRLQLQYERVEAQMRMLIVAGNDTSASVTRLVAEHQPLLDVLLSGKPSLAGSAFRAHSEKAGKETMARLLAPSADVASS